MNDEEIMDAFLEKFKRKPEDPRPEWAFKGDNILREMDEVPLFMTDVPENVDQIPALAALQSLIYDGTPEEVAKNFKEQGNEAYKMGPKSYPDAIKYYTQGLEQNCSNPSLNALLHLNRAAVQVSKQNFGLALEDCRAALRLDDPNAEGFEGVFLKGNLRAAKACLGLGLFQDGLRHLENIFQYHNNASVLDEATKLKKSTMEAQEEAERKSRELEKRSKVEKKIDILLKSRGMAREYGCDKDVLSLLGPGFEPSALPRLSLVPKSANQLQWPVFLFYPPYGQMDCLEAVHEQTTLADLLDLTLAQRPEWDSEGLYAKNKKFRVFYHPSDDGADLYSVDLKYRLADLYGKLIKRVDSGLLAFFVLPVGGDGDFLSRFPAPPAPFKP